MPDAHDTETLAEVLAEAIRSVTDLWDEPLDEVHDIPPIVNAILAEARIVQARAGEGALRERIAREIQAAKPFHPTRNYTPVDEAYDRAARIALGTEKS
jgi:hypothetical protein